MTKLLGVNIDHVATLRQARGTNYPNVLEAALIVERVGASSITVHMREDLRHIQPRDVLALKEALKIPLNLEMAATDGMISFAEDILPKYCCLVPEKREELTTEGGLNVILHQKHIKNTVEALTNAGIIVSLFIDPDLSQIDAAKASGAKVIELHTGDYANAVSPDERQYCLNHLKTAATYAEQLGMQVNAGHGLEYENTQAIVAIPEVKELNIGHSIISRALFVGLEQAVKEMLDIVRS